MATEKMIGLGTEHPYLECGSCGTVQLIEVPTDMDRFYPPGYYSFSTYRGAIARPLAEIRRRRVRAIVSDDRVGRAINAILGVPTVASFTKVVEASPDDRILDVGAGSAIWSLTCAKHDSGTTVTASDWPVIVEIAAGFAEQEFAPGPRYCRKPCPGI